jgi:hypothetical protein
LVSESVDGDLNSVGFPVQMGLWGEKAMVMEQGGQLEETVDGGRLVCVVGLGFKHDVAVQGAAMLVFALFSKW